jgi:hypothetical protein
MDVLLDQIHHDAYELADEVAGLREKQQDVLFDGGATVRGDITLALLLGELLLHGWDLAREARVPWTFTPQEASLLLDGGVAVMPGWTTPKGRRHSGTYEVRVRGGTRVRFSFDNGHVRLAGAEERPDVLMSGTPDAIALTSYGRRSPILFALTGRMLVYGRRPWRGLILPTLVQAP